MKTFKGKFVRNNGEPVGFTYTFNTKEDIVEKEKFLFNEYHDPVFVEEILEVSIETIELNGKTISIKEVTLRNEEDEKETRSC